MKWIAQTASEAKTVADGARFCLDEGASACYVHGGVMDHLLAAGRLEEVRAATDLVRAAGLPAGIAGHLPGVFLWAEAHLDLDFYMVSYYNPIPRGESPHNRPGTEERFAAEDRDERVALIQTLKRPVIHYKVLAAGRTPPAEGLALHSGVVPAGPHLRADRRSLGRRQAAPGGG